MLAQRIDDGWRRVAFHGNYQFAFVSEVDRFQAKQFTKPAYRRFNGQIALVKFDSATAAGGKLMGDGVDAAARGITHRFNARQTTNRLDQRGKYRAVAFEIAIDPQLLAQIENGCAMIPQRPGHNQHIPGADILRRPVNILRDRTYTGRIDKQFVRRAARHHFSIAGNNHDAFGMGGGRHTVDHLLQRLHRQSFFKDESAGEPAWDRAAHCDIVSGAANRQFADIATGEKQRIDDVTVGGKRQPIAVRRQFRQRDTRLIFLNTE